MVVVRQRACWCWLKGPHCSVSPSCLHGYDGVFMFAAEAEKPPAQIWRYVGWPSLTKVASGSASRGCQRGFKTTQFCLHVKLCSPLLTGLGFENNHCLVHPTAETVAFRHKIARRDYKNSRGDFVSLRNCFYLFKRLYSEDGKTLDLWAPLDFCFSCGTKQNPELRP